MVGKKGRNCKTKCRGEGVYRASHLPHRTPNPGPTRSGKAWSAFNCHGARRNLFVMACEQPMSGVQAELEPSDGAPCPSAAVSRRLGRRRKEKARNKERALGLAVLEAT